MTKQEFIQEAALRVIGNFASTAQEVADFAQELADIIYGEDESSDQSRPSPTISDQDTLEAIPHNEPIEVLIKEIDRMDEENTRTHNLEAKIKGYSCHYQKSGYAEKIRKACVVRGFKHVHELVFFGRADFRRQRQIGEKCCNILDKALMNLYNVKAW